MAPDIQIGLRGQSIPITARVLQIVDVYDALTTERPYKRAFSSTEALQTMKEEVAKGWWDPEIFDQFEKLIANCRRDWFISWRGRSALANPRMEAFARNEIVLRTRRRGVIKFEQG